MGPGGPGEKRCMSSRDSYLSPTITTVGAAPRNTAGGRRAPGPEKTPRYFPPFPKTRPMAGVGKLLKTAQKMQRSIETLQSQLEARELEVTAGGGAVRVKVTASGKFLSLVLDPEFLKEDPKVVADTVLSAVQDAARQAKELNDSEMQKVTSAFQMPGGF